MGQTKKLSALVILDIQHAGRPGKNDLGASHDFDGDGLVEQGENEAELTPLYADAAKEALEALGVQVEVFRSQSYKQRWKRAAKKAAEVDGPVAYVACHLNAGAETGKGYGLVCFDSRSSGGARLARDVGKELELEFSADEVSRVIWDARAATGNPTSWFPRAIHTISGIYDGPANLSGICFEPLFLDAHSELLGKLTKAEAAEKKRSELEHASRNVGAAPVERTRTRGELRAESRRARTLDRVGRALASGCLAWIQSRTR
jgi:hypothetical protein